MTDPYRISDPSTVEPRSHREPLGVLRPALWLLLIVSLAANAATSTMGFSVLVSAAFGLVALACATALIMQHYRNRRTH